MKTVALLCATLVFSACSKPEAPPAPSSESTAVDTAKNDAPPVVPAMPDIDILLDKALQHAGLFKGSTVGDRKTDSFGYSMYIHYDKSLFTDIWAGREEQTAYTDNYHLATQFVEALTAAGFNAHDQGWNVTVCAQEDGIVTVTGRPAIHLLGCANYSPSSDRVDPDFKKPE